MRLQGIAWGNAKESLVLNDNRAVITIERYLERESVVLANTRTIVSSKCDVMRHTTNYTRLGTDRREIHIVYHETII